MREDILKLIGEIQMLAVQISTNTKHDVIVKYFGHVNAITVGFHKNGYSAGYPEEEICDIYMEIHTNAQNKAELKRVKRKLEELRRK